MKNLSDTPDFILADFLEDVLHAFSRATQRRMQWYSGRLDRAETLACEPASPASLTPAEAERISAYLGFSYARKTASPASAAASAAENSPQGSPLWWQGQWDSAMQLLQQQGCDIEMVLRQAGEAWGFDHPEVENPFLRSFTPEKTQTWGSTLDDLCKSLGLSDEEITSVKRVATYAGHWFTEDKAKVRKALSAYPGRSTLEAAEKQAELCRLLKLQEREVELHQALDLASECIARMETWVGSLRDPHAGETLLEGLRQKLNGQDRKVTPSRG